MSKTVSVTEAQSKLSSLVEWANEYQDGVIVQRRGSPTAAIISYADYEELVRLRQQEKKRKALEALRELRILVRTRNPDLTAEEAYRLAGFGEQVIQETLANDKQFAESEQ